MPTGWRPASGRIGGDGRFTLTTTVAGDGCAVGTHPVVVLAGESLSPETMKWHAPQKYADSQDVQPHGDHHRADRRPEDRVEGGWRQARRPKVIKEGGTEFGQVSRPCARKCHPSGG